MANKKIAPEVIQKLEASKKAVLKRIAESLEKQASGDTFSAAHNSHSSGTGKGHTSYVNH